MKATISGDIVAFTSLTDEGREVLSERFRVLLDLLKKQYNIYGRIVKGDYLECYLPNPEDALRVMLIIKCYVKSLPIDFKKKSTGINIFRTHGIRLAIGLGEITRFNAKKGIIDGEAIYLSGRLINQQSKTYKERKIIKSTLFIEAANKTITEEFEPVLALIDVLMARATARQCEVLFHRLIGKSEAEAAKTLQVSQPTINQHSTSAGWNAIEKAVLRFTTVIQNL